MSPAKSKSPPLGTSLHELTCAHVDATGRIARKELDKRVLSTDGKWALVAYRFQDYDTRADDGSYRAARVSLVRYNRRGLQYYRCTSFTMSPTQCAQLVDLFVDWLGIEGEVGKLREEVAPFYPELELSPVTPTSRAPVSTPASAAGAESAAGAASSDPSSATVPSVVTSASDEAPSPAESD